MNRRDESRDDANTWFAQLSSSARSAIATIVIRGPVAKQAIDAHFNSVSGRSVSKAKQNQLVYGHWHGVSSDRQTDAPDAQPNPAGEGVVVCRTDTQEFEIHCHGGIAAQSAIADDLTRFGLDSKSQNDAVHLLSDDTVKAESAEALLQATTDRTAEILLNQHNGAFHQELQKCQRHLHNNDRSTAIRLVDSLLNRSRAGLHLTKPFRVVIAGRPNVGKSSLINCLLGYRRSIVFDQPGTTRDIVSASAAFNGWPVELSDTAGLRVGEDEIENVGVEKAISILNCADLVVLVLDCSSNWDHEQQKKLDTYEGALVVWNKSDISPTAATGEKIAETVSRYGALQTSASTGEGIDRLSAEIGNRLVPELPPPGSAVPFTQRQVQLLQDARDALEHGQSQPAMDSLSRIICGQ